LAFLLHTFINSNIYILECIRYTPLCNKYLFGYVISTYVTVLKIQLYLKLAQMYLYWIHKNLYHGYKNLSVAAMKKNCILQICIKQFRDVNGKSAASYLADCNNESIEQ
jgi:hypothetical protein